MAQDFDADAMLAFFGQLGKEVDNLKTKITGLNEVGGKGTSNLTREFERFGKTVEHYTRGPLKAMDQAAAGLAKTLMGAGGLALSLGAAAKAFDTFAVGELRIRNFATNTGFAVGAIKDMRVQLSAAGIDASEASSGIASIGSKLQEVLALQETSSFYRELSKSSPALAEQVRQLMNAGKQQEAMNALQQAYNNGGERFKAWLPTVTGLSRAAFEAGKYGMEGLIKPWEFNQKEAAKYHKTMTNLETIGDSVWTSMSYTMLEGIAKMMGPEGIDGLNEKAKSFAQGFKTFFNTYVMPALATTKQEFDWVVSAIGEIDKFITKWTGGKKPGEQKDEKDKTLPLGSIRTERAIIDSMNEQLPGGPEGGKAGGLWEWIEKQMSIGVQAAEVEPGSTLLEQKESIETDKDSNKLIRDMRDTLQKWDQRESGGRAGGAGFAGVGIAGGGTGGAGAPMGSSGPGAGQSYPQSKGGGGPAETTGDLGDSGPVGTLAEQRAGFKKEFENNPQLKKFAIDAMQHEGGIQSNMEQLFNYASMRHMTIQQALHSGQYGPVNKHLISGNISAKTAAEGESALEKVFAGSNITDYATDQGMRGDPNYAKYMSNQKYWGMHKVEGAWFSAHGEKGRRWAEAQRAATAKAGTGVWSGSGSAIPYAGFSRDSIDHALRAGSGGGNLGTANVDINFDSAAKEKALKDKINDAFIDLKIHRSPQAAAAGGGVTAFNTYSFE
jgi:hypothetical protein